MAQAFTCSWELLKLLDECQKNKSRVFMPAYHGQVPDFVPYFQQLLQAWRLGSWGSSSCVELVGHQAETPQEGTKVSFGNGTFGRWDGYGWWSFWQMFRCLLWKRLAYLLISMCHVWYFQAASMQQVWLILQILLGSITYKAKVDSGVLSV